MALIGVQTPRLFLAPEATEDDSRAQDCIDLAAAVGLVLDPWQRLVFKAALSVRPDDIWAAFEVALIVSRQNGKGALLEARMLAGLFLFGEQLQLYSSHEFKSSIEMFRRLVFLITNSDALRKRVKRIPTSHGEEGIELLNGQRCRFVARSSGSGRGFTADTIYFDEAYNLPSSTIAALLPTMSARPNPQLWYTSSAGWEISTALASVRNRGLAADPTDKRLAFLEWSADENNYDVADPDDWARANPALGIRIDEGFVEAELSAMKDDPAMFARERLGVGQWPVTADSWSVIPEKVWRELSDPLARMLDPVAFAVDVTPDRLRTSLAAAGVDGAGHQIIELIDHRGGTAWVVDRIVELVRKHKPTAIVLSPRGPAGSLLADLQSALGEIHREHLLVLPTGSQEAQACSAFYDAATDSMSLRHRDQVALATALAGARQKVLTEGAWTWNRRAVTVDISPLWASTLALWGHQSAKKRLQPFIMVGS